MGAGGRPVRAPDGFRSQGIREERLRDHRGREAHQGPATVRAETRGVYITERQWHPSQAFHMRRNGCVEMRFETTGRLFCICPQFAPSTFKEQYGLWGASLSAMFRLTR